MAAGRIVLPPYFPARDRDARLVSGAKLTVYVNNTTTKASIFSDYAMETPSQNPVVANSSGQFPAIYCEAGTVETPTLYSLAIAGPNGENIGNPSVFDNWQPSVDGDSAAQALAEAAADTAVLAAAQAEAALADVLGVVATGSDAAAIAARAAKSANLSDLTDPGAARTNIGADLAANVYVTQAGTGAVSRAVQTVLREMAVTPQDYLDVGESIDDDAGPAIRRALATGKPVRFPSATYMVGPDPASENDGLFVYSISIPSDAVLIFDDGATIKAIDGITSWNRTVVLGQSGAPVSNIRIFGELRVDSNVQNVGTPTNEHMHSVLIYECSGSYIERIHASNARGDNVFIGGDENTRGSHDNYIGSIYARTAGRKCFVGGSWDSNYIGSIDVDNSLGGWTGSALAGAGSGVDIEPDGYTGAVRNENWIGAIISRGSGDDFTAGTGETQSSAYVLNIGTYDLEVTTPTDQPWLQYGMTLNIGYLRIAGASDSTLESTIQYAARLNVGTLRLEGGRAGYMFLLARSGSDVPKMRVETLHIENTAADFASGIENRNGELWVNRLIAKQEKGEVIWNRSVTAGQKAIARIGSAEFFNCGHTDRGSEIIISTGAAGDTITEVGSIIQSDNRFAKAATIFSVGAGTADGLSIGTVNKESATALVTYGGSDKFYRVSAPLPLVATADLPAGAAARNGMVLTEDAGSGARNLILYSNAQRFRIAGGTAF